MNMMSEQEYQEIEALLPWHAVGTLGRRDAARVEAALKTDAEMRHRFEEAREELTETILLNETLGAPSARAMEKLFAAIDKEPAREPAVSFNLGARLAAFMADFSPRTLAWSAGAAVLAIVLQAGLIAGIMMEERGAGPQLASYGEQVKAPGTIAIVRFSPQASAADITRFLQANKATIVGGPSAGLYRVRLAVTGMPKEELARLLKKLQEDKTVGFVAPAD
jgi:anti-sigma-K factor RskA